MVTAKFDDILTAFEFASFGGVEEVEAYLSLERGTVHFSTDADYGDPEDVPDDLETGPYLALPRKADLDLGRDLAIRFALERLPEDVEAIVGFFRHHGAYGKFKGLLERKGKLQEWFEYEEAAKEARLREWCAENGVELV